MMTPATEQKRKDLLTFIERVLADDPAVQAVVGIGSIATGHARPGSDIDGIVFLEPYDLYALPAESIWRPSDGSFHSIFTHEPWVDVEGIQIDAYRVDLAEWANPAFVWTEGRKAELHEGWVAYDRAGKVTPLIAARTAYTEAIRTARIDEAITWLDQHLNDEGPQVRWDTLGPLIAHDRLHAAYTYWVAGLFAYNRRWQPWRNREMTYLLALPWLPKNFEPRMLMAANVSSLDYAGYMARVAALRDLFDALVQQLVMEGFYGADPISEAFIRRAEEPGRAWNMQAWNERHVKRGDIGRDVSKS